MQKRIYKVPRYKASKGVTSLKQRSQRSYSVESFILEKKIL